jgi:hypothetical protein
MNHFVHMIFIMLFAGLFSTMSMWSNQYSDVRLSINDLYMIFLMLGWSIFFMGIYDKEIKKTSIGFFLVLIVFISIRKQIFVTEKQFIKGMIQHHSMGVLMSKRRKEKGIKNKQLEQLIDSIIRTQQDEINILKGLEDKN